MTINRILSIFLYSLFGAVLFTLPVGCTPDSYQAAEQIKLLPENAGARIAQWPGDTQEFVVVRQDGSVWRYRSISTAALGTGIRNGKVADRTPNLRNEDQVLPAPER